jgi:Spy/CpxP family protein refolding chaperone
MKRFSFLSIAALALCFGVAMAQPSAPPAPEPAFDDGPAFEEFDRPHVQQLFGEKLGLSAEQKDQIQKITLEARKKNIEVEAKGKLARIELHEAMAADTPDQKKIDAKIAELSQVHETRLRSHVETMLAIKKVLTPEQRAKLKELQPLGMGRPGRTGGFGHGPGMMGGGRHQMGPRHGIAPRGERQ